MYHFPHEDFTNYLGDFAVFNTETIHAYVVGYWFSGHGLVSQQLSCVYLIIQIP